MDQKELNNAYQTLENHVREAEEYVKTWKSYQALWDIEAAHIFKILGENIEKWH